MLKNITELRDSVGGGWVRYHLHYTHEYYFKIRIIHQYNNLFSIIIKKILFLLNTN